MNTATFTEWCLLVLGGAAEGECGVITLEQVVG